MLPIEQVLPELIIAIQDHPQVVVQAPPGAGKTTRIPLALLECDWLKGKIIVIQPRRLAVYNAAQRLAAQLNEQPGKTVGYRTRYDRCIAKQNRIEVVTDGVFLAQLQRDPELRDVDVVLFDEFHERSVNIDLGLAFTLETQAALRGDDHPLRLVVMSATLDGDRLCQWLDAPLVTSAGRTHPVETFYRPPPPDRYPHQHISHVIQEALRKEQGSLLVFLPGMGDIRSVQRQLEQGGLPNNVEVLPLHASLPKEQQQKALAPSPSGQRKVVLSTNVAETSITIEDVRVVIDSGQARIARYDERRGLNGLHTEMISAASAEQRRGRAGRTQPGSCYRLWGESRQTALKPFNDPEILTTDLQPVALELAQWGVTDITSLTLLDTPPTERLQRAREGLQQLGALRPDGNITPLGRKLSLLGLPPRLAALVWACHGSPAEAEAISCAAILSEGDPLSRNNDHFQSDLHLRLEWMENGNRNGSPSRLHALRAQLQKRLQQHSKSEGQNTNLAQALVRAFPDRVAQQRTSNALRYRMSNGKGAQLQRHDKLATHRYLIVLDAAGTGTDATIHLAYPVTEQDLKSALAEQISRQSSLSWDEQKQAVIAEQRTEFGALTLQQQPLTKPWPAPQQEQAKSLLLHALAATQLTALPWDDASRHFCERINWLGRQQPDHWPDFGLQALTEQAPQWLSPFLENCYSFKDLNTIPLLDALKSHLGWQRLAELDNAAPSYWNLATGNHQVHYRNGTPTLSVRLQECYGIQQHPTLPGGEPITVELLSPARRPIQITQDLPAFWSGSYREVAKEMRGRYPKHFWPDDPASAQATTRTKNALGK
ncbi:MAG: ATP-dependent helicase HrpB [Ketobacter sp.]|nr:ATP-dependent helicase HrpB [Ketobacter sp.]